MRTVPSQPPTRRLCRLDDIEDGRSRGFDPLGEGRDTMFVIRRGNSAFAYRNACPHYENARMAWRKDEFLDAARRHVRCAAHGALFVIEDGICVSGPCVGRSLTPVPIIVVQGDIRLAGAYAPGRRSRAARTTEPTQRSSIMVTEIVLITIDPRRSEAFEAAVAECAPLFERAPGCTSMRLEREVEDEARYRLFVDWNTVEDHMTGFRQSDDFASWRAIAGPFFTEPPVMVHSRRSAAFF